MNHESAYGLWSLVISIRWSSSSSRLASRSLVPSVIGDPSVLFPPFRGAARRNVWVSADDLLDCRLGSKAVSNLDLFSHDAGHLWNTLLGWDINPHFDPLHILSNILIFGGFILLATSWKVLYEAQRSETLATTGPYAHVRHPQYVGFILIMLGFLFQWPTLVTLFMFPILVTMYVKLARREEREVLAEFGETYRRYVASTPAFLPRFGRGPRIREALELYHRMSLKMF